MPAYVLTQSVQHAQTTQELSFTWLALCFCQCGMLTASSARACYSLLLGHQIPNIRQAAVCRSRWCECCCLPADPLNYQDNTLNIHEDMAELDYWLGVLEDQIRTAVEKAISSSDGSRGTVLAACCAAEPLAACWFCEGGCKQCGDDEVHCS